MKIKFIKSPTGLFNLGYGIGGIGDIEKTMANKCIAEGYAVEVIEKKAPIKKTIKKAK
tara:strand:- start:676 stop:849 length:174 start_codon:yes stop_codon:yes gene_type:complete